MDLQKLFEVQAGLDLHITNEHPVLGNENRLAKKILALQVELGECANEWRGFKFWSNDQEPRTWVSTGICMYCAGTGNQNFDDENAYDEDCDWCGGGGETSKNPLLEEYVDCLHFILSIGLELGLTDWKPSFSKVALYFGGDEVIAQFGEVFRYISTYSLYSKDEQSLWYSTMFSNFLGLSKSLGFTWEQVEQAYFEKNKINHQRQQEGY